MNVKLNKISEKVLNLVHFHVVYAVLSKIGTSKYEKYYRVLNN